MTSGALTVKGVVHGKTVELEQEPGWPDGQPVTVTIQAARESKLAPGEGLKRAFGAWAEGADDLDKYLEWNRQQRKISRPEIEP